MTKEPYIAVNATFYAKQLPNGYVGLTRETWNFGKKEALPLDQLIGHLAHSLIDFSLMTMPVDTDALNETIQKAAKYIANLKVEEVPK